MFFFVLFLFFCFFATWLIQRNDNFLLISGIFEYLQTMTKHNYYWNTEKKTQLQLHQVSLMKDICSRFYEGAQQPLPLSPSPHLWPAQKKPSLNRVNRQRSSILCKYKINNPLWKIPEFCGFQRLKSDS